MGMGVTMLALFDVVYSSDKVLSFLWLCFNEVLYLLGNYFSVEQTSSGYSCLGLVFVGGMVQECKVPCCKIIRHHDLIVP